MAASKDIKWLQDAVEEHIKNNPKKDSVDICAHFKLRADITMEAIGELVKDGKVTRQHLFGYKFGYVHKTFSEFNFVH